MYYLLLTNGFAIITLMFILQIETRDVCSKIVDTASYLLDHNGANEIE